MSYTEIFAFDKNGIAYSCGLIENSWFSGPAIWRILEEKYLPPYRPDCLPEHMKNASDDEIERWLGCKPTRINFMFDGKGIKEIWDLFNSDKVLPVDKIVLGSTFENVVVLKNDMPELMSAFNLFSGETNLKEQAAVIQKMINDENCIAVGWNQTTVNGADWSTKGFYDDVTGECSPYNIFKSDNSELHWDLFSEIRASHKNIN